MCLSTYVHVFINIPGVLLISGLLHFYWLQFLFFDKGNKETLGTRPNELGLDVRAELLKFHSQHYSSNLMTFVVLGRGKVYMQFPPVVIIEKHYHI